LTYTKAAMDN